MCIYYYYHYYYYHTASIEFYHIYRRAQSVFASRSRALCNFKAFQCHMPALQSLTLAF